MLCVVCRESLVRPVRMALLVLWWVSFSFLLNRLIYQFHQKTESPFFSSVFSRALAVCLVREDALDLLDLL